MNKIWNKWLNSKNLLKQIILVPNRLDICRNQDSRVSCKCILKHINPFIAKNSNVSPKCFWHCTACVLLTLEEIWCRLEKTEASSIVSKLFRQQSLKGPVQLYYSTSRCTRPRVSAPWLCWPSTGSSKDCLTMLSWTVGGRCV
jgi:hypothetical protein